MQSVLIVGSREDPHVNVVRANLAEFGARTCIFDRYRSDNLASFSIQDDTVDFVLSHDNEKFSLEDFTAVWWRQKPLKVWDLSNSRRFLAQEFSEREWAFVLRSIFQIIPETRWVNKLVPHVEWARKPAQLKLAQDCRFHVPETLISNDPEKIRRFTQRGPTIYKPLSNFVFPPNEYIFSTLITLDDLINDQMIQRAPGIYQRYIDKSYEVRATFVGDRIFWINIDSQKHDATRIDWRHSQLENMYSIGNADKFVELCIRDFMQKANLDYGAFDFAVDKENVFWFLECNPAGQWLWLEEATGIGISNCLSEYLLGKSDI